ncbi:MAG: ABC transporter permease, partial [Bacteroidaceae bacterium]|nr:ABC transporter permease [Bacteroidaceae bacterium]
MKIAIKNFITTLKRYKAASMLNLLGLAMAFAAFYVIMTQVYSAFTFNASIKDNERVYMVSPYHEGLGGWSENVPNPICYETAAELPQVEAIASMNPFGDDVPVWIKREGENYERNKMTVVRCTSSILDVFSFDIIAGNVDDFKQKDAVVLSQSTAEAMGITVGSIIKLDEGNVKPGTPLTVVALFKDFPQNTILAGREAFRNDNREYGMTNNNWNYSVFVKL